MRAIGLGIALILAGTVPEAQTLLETVLYIVSLQEEGDDRVVGVTVTEDEHSISAEVYTRLRSEVPNMWTRSVRVKHIGDCKFEVDDKFGPAQFYHPIYTIDFSDADLDGAHPVDPAETRTKFGLTDSNPIVIPRARYCLLKGIPPLNDIDVGSCADKFFAHADLRPWGPARILAAVRSLRGLCAKVS